MVFVGNQVPKREKEREREIERERERERGGCLHESKGLFHKTFYFAVYGQMDVNYGIFQFVWKFTVKI